MEEHFMKKIEEKKVSANDAVINMLHHINNDNKKGFYDTAEEYLNGLSRGSKFFDRVRRLLSSRPNKLIQLDALPKEIKNLIIQASIKDENVFLNEKVRGLIDELLIEWKNAEAFKYHNMPTRNKILLHGETGNGKTTIARHIAKLSELPFIEVNNDIVIDSHLGSTGANIHNLFKQINQPCVLFWDEIDSIGRKRGANTSSSAAIENDRMVNSILVNIEKLNEDVIFIGATNRMDVLDSAFVRRFDVKLELPSPEDFEKEAFVDKLVNYYKLPSHFLSNDSGGHSDDTNSNWIRSKAIKGYISDCISYSELKSMILDDARKFVLTNLKTNK